MSGSTALEQRHGVGAVLRHRHVVAACDEVRPHEVDDVLVVLDQQDAGPSDDMGSSVDTTLHAAPLGRLGRQGDHERGAAVDAAVTRVAPPWASTMPSGDRQPEPGAGDVAGAADVGLGRSRSATAGVMPRAVVADLDLDGARATGARTVTSTPSSERPWVTAFSRRFTITCSSRSWSAHTGSSVVVDVHPDARRRRARSRPPPRPRGGRRTSPA